VSAHGSELKSAPLHHSARGALGRYRHLSGFRFFVITQPGRAGRQESTLGRGTGAIVAPRGSQGIPNNGLAMRGDSDYILRLLQTALGN
jgi:hypothetical protein